MNTPVAMAQQKKLPFVLFELKGGLYAVGSENIKEIVTIPVTTRVPNVSPEIRGVMNLRGKIIPLIDLRHKLGLPLLRTEMDELIQLLNAREEDHRNWLDELEACVREGRPFALARDPHKCKFGLWYDKYKTEDRLLRMTLPSMDAPHKAIHATADEVLHRAERGDRAGALALIEERRNHELAALVKLFAASRQTLSDGLREVAIVLERDKKRLAFSADLVETTEDLPQEFIEPIPPALGVLNGSLSCRIARRPRSGQAIVVLDDDFLFQRTL